MNIRREAFKILQKIEEKKSYSNILLNSRAKGLDKRDSNFLREIVYGVIENKLKLEYVISKYSNIKYERISASAKTILKIGIYQIFYMDRVPASAAVNESVNLSKKYCNRGAQGFINGMLRTISREVDSFKVPRDDMAIYLSIEYSYPKWIIDKFISQYGEKFTEDLCIENSKKKNITVRVNTLKTDRDTLSKRLKESGQDNLNTEYSQDCLEITNPDNIINTKEYLKGSYSIQGEASSLVGQALSPRPGKKVLDLCSAPGGKSMHLAELMGNSGLIISRDIYDHKLDQINKNTRRLGIDIVKTEKWDATILDKDFLDTMDYCIVDVPCSALGLIGKKPEIKYNRSSEELRQLPKLQLNILENASSYLKVGGEMIYSTCTINKTENLGVVEEFLERNDNFKLEPFYENIPIEEAKNGYLNLYPNIHKTDGFFIAKLKRI